MEDPLEKLKGYQKKYLRGLAHKLNPVVLIGHKGLTPELVQAVDQALGRHELIKIKFVESKEKDRKTGAIKILEDETHCEMVGMIGHTAILYRSQSDPAKRNITLPEKEEEWISDKALKS